MTSPLILKLEQAGILDEADREVLRAIPAETRSVGAHEDLIREGERPESLRLVVDGLAYRYKMLANGRRQILALLLPGDFCDIYGAILGEMDHCVATLSAIQVVEIPRAIVAEITAHHPRIAHALLQAVLVDEGILRAWLANMGQREATEQAAHLFCELFVRLEAVGLASPTGYELPMTQIELADLLGFTPVHANRMLRELRESGLVTMRGKFVQIPDAARLMAFCGFDSRYLRLRPRGIAS